MKKSLLQRWTLILLFGLMLLAAGCARDNNDDGVMSQSKGLYQCKNCDEVLGWLQDMAIQRMERQIEANRNGGGIVTDDDALPPDQGTDDSSGGNDDDDDFAADDDTYAAGDDEADNQEGSGDDDGHSDTNVQEEGVDEADMVKTDGDYLYLLAGGYLIIFDANPEQNTQEISRVDIEGSVADMYLYGHLALVFSNIWSENLAPEVWPDVDHALLFSQILKITVIDHSNKIDPVVIRELYVEGTLASSRRVNGSVRIVTNCFKGGPYVETWLDPSQYGSPEELDAAYDVLDQQNQAIIESAGLEEWLPRYYNIIHEGSGSEADSGIVTDCDNFYHPYDPLGDAVLSVLTVNLDDPTGNQVNVSVLAEGYVIYASQLNLYVTGSFQSSWDWAMDQTSFTDSNLIHQFDIASDPAQAIYTASGEIQGWVLNQYSLSEYDGYLRLATTYGDWWENGPQRNGIFVLKAENGNLNVVGQITDLAVEEQIESARFIEKRGFLVTFLQTDPLFTIDLSDPQHPMVVGQLEVPGFSTYLHPMGDDYLLAIGQGGSGGVTLSMFDVSDFANPQRIQYYDFGWDAYSDAQYQPHAFLYYPSKNLLAIPIQTYGWGDDDTVWPDDDTAIPPADDDTMIEPDRDGDDPAPPPADDDTSVPADDDTTVPADDDTAGGNAFSGVYAFFVTPETGFVKQAGIDHSAFTGEAGSDPYYGAPTPRRSVVVGNYLFTISDLGLVVTEIGTWVNYQEINLPYETPDYGYDEGGGVEGGGSSGGEDDSVDSGEAPPAEDGN